MRAIASLRRGSSSGLQSATSALQGLARRVDQALGDGLAAVGEVVVVEEPALVEQVDLLAHPGGVDRAVLGDRVGVVEVDALVGLDEQPGGAGRQVDTGCVDGALDVRLRALAAEQAGELAGQLAQRVAARRGGEGLADAGRLDASGAAGVPRSATRAGRRPRGSRRRRERRSRASR